MGERKGPEEVTHELVSDTIGFLSESRHLGPGTGSGVRENPACQAELKKINLLLRAQEEGERYPNTNN